MKKNYRKFKEMDIETIKQLMKLPKNEAMELINRINVRMHQEKDIILEQAFEEGVFTKEGYVENYKGMFYDDFGSDSFIQYIDAVMNAKIDYFVTENMRLIKAREQLQNRFGLKIATPKEIIEKND